MDPNIDLNFMTALNNIQTHLNAQPDIQNAIENIKDTKQWNDSSVTALLTGKLFSRIVKSVSCKLSFSFHRCSSSHCLLFTNYLVEKKLLAERDEVIQARIEALLELLQSTNNDEASLMVLNSLETYKKFLICETEMQNKVTSKTVDTLIEALLIIYCHRKEFEHLNSMVRRIGIF